MENEKQRAIRPIQNKKKEQELTKLLKTRAKKYRFKIDRRQKILTKNIIKLGIC